MFAAKNLLLTRPTAVDVALSFVGTANTAASTSVTVPSHQVGDLIVVGAAGTSSVPSIPSAGGTVPSFSTPTNGSGGTMNSHMRVGLAVATATNHTTGTWSGAGEICCFILRGQDLSDYIGASAVSTENPASTVTAPSVTLEDTSGASILVHFYTCGATAWGSAPAGYTRRAAVVASGIHGLCVNTKTSSTSDGSVAQGFTHGGLYGGGVGITLEILN